MGILNRVRAVLLALARKELNTYTDRHKVNDLMRTFVQLGFISHDEFLWASMMCSLSVRAI